MKAGDRECEEALLGAQKLLKHPVESLSGAVREGIEVTTTWPHLGGRLFSVTQRRLISRRWRRQKPVDKCAPTLDGLTNDGSSSHQPRVSAIAWRLE